MTPVPFDFRKPPPGELVRVAAAWLAQTCRRASVPWTRLLSYPAELKPGAVEALTASKALAALPEECVALTGATQSAGDGTLLVIMQRPLLLSLLAGLVGEVPAALPADREPSEIESSLVGYLTRELFLDPLERAWPASDTPRLSARPPAPPRVAWAGAPNDPAIFSTLSIATPFGEHPVYFLVPRAGRWERLAEADTKPKVGEAVPPEQMESLVREMSVDLAVVLGTADLTMHDLAGLNTGDVVVLRQKVTQPLDGLVAGTRKFRVWPGVIGTRAAVVIDAPAED